MAERVNKLTNFFSAKQTLALSLFLFPFSQLVVGGFATVFLAAITTLFTGGTFDDALNGESGTLLTFATLVFAYAFLLFAIKGLVKLRNYKLSDIGLKKPTIEDIGWGVLGYIGFVIIFLIVSFIMTLIPFIDTDQVQEITKMDSSSVGAMIALFLGLVIAAPLVEELMFRGFLYTGLRTKWRFLPALIVTSLYFGIVHIELSPDANWAAVIATTILSVVLVTLREKTGSLTAPIIVHGLNNFVAFIFVFALQI
ncbi:MAG: CPBP family intramembrane metalloprotease [bacterium]|nr:CPBP family intramembrane metalloprotease [bacterium]